MLAKGCKLQFRYYYTQQQPSLIVHKYAEKIPVSFLPKLRAVSAALTTLLCFIYLLIIVISQIISTTNGRAHGPYDILKANLILTQKVLNNFLAAFDPKNKTWSMLLLSISWDTSLDDATQLQSQETLFFILRINFSECVKSNGSYLGNNALWQTAAQSYMQKKVVLAARSGKTMTILPIWAWNISLCHQ